MSIYAAVRDHYEPTITELRESLLAAPKMIREQKLKVCRLQDEVRARNRELEEAKEAVKNAEALLILGISAEVDPLTGKPVFTNDKARSGELARRKQTDPEYISAVEKVAEAERLLSVAQANLDIERAEFEYQQNLMTTRQSIAELTAAELLALVR